jgi:acetyl esterase/lipase
MRIVISCFLLLLSRSNVIAQDINLPLWPEGKIPNSISSGEKEKWDSLDILWVRNVQVPAISVYFPTKKTATGQAVVICPGGGYNNLAYNWEGSDPARWLAAKGIVAIVLKYRLPEPKSNVNPTLSPLMDAKRAIRIARFYAGKWGIQKNKIGIMGFSAGGHLASTAGTHFDAGISSAADSIEQQSSRPDFMVLVYPVISMSKNIMHRGSRNRLIGQNPDSATAKLYSNELQVTKDTPPTFLLHTTDDRTVPVENSLLFYQALKDNGVAAEMHIFPKGGHGFAMGTGYGAVEKWMDICHEWIMELEKEK